MFEISITEIREGETATVATNAINRFMRQVDYLDIENMISAISKEIIRSKPPRRHRRNGGPKIVK